MAVDSLTLSVPSTTAVSGSLTPRYQYVSVTNMTGAQIFVRTDGQAATVDGDFCSALLPGEVAVLANMTPLWEQAQTVIQNGTVNQAGQWQAGKAANPGTPISVIAVTAPAAGPPAPVVVIQGAG
jgi:hypothetical protein